MDDTLHPLNNYSKISLYLAASIVCFHLIWLSIYLLLFAVIFPAYDLNSFSQLFFVDLFHQGMSGYLLLLLPISLQLTIMILAIVFYNKKHYKIALGLALLVFSNTLFGLLQLII